MGGKWEQTAILGIDMQKDFIHWDGLLRVNGGKAIIPNVVREHDPQGREVEWFRHHLYAASKLGPTVKGSVSAELVDGLVIEEDPSYAFFATHLHSFLESYGIGDLVIPGVQAPNCIRQTAFDAVTLDYKSVTVIADATAAATPEAHAANTYDMKNAGVATPALQEWCEADA